MEINLEKIYVGKRSIAPSKIICVGRNYVEHIRELNSEFPEDMVVFIKPNSAISEALRSFQGEQIHYEAELCFLYEKDRFSAVGFGLDLTKRKLQGKLKSKGLPWERSKAFDGSAIFSEFVEISDISPKLNFELTINKEIIQSGSISLMIYKPDKVLSEISTFMSLKNGDIVMTGTPKGVGPVNKGDVFVGSVKDNDEVIASGEWIAS
jgi:2-keto-4-pentenoate hydratase/2-oxohepta-3-ene-1,7-dioic acid hydratase in catechol pathway